MRKYYGPDKVSHEVPLESIPEEVRALYLRPGELMAIQEQFPVAYQPLGTLEWHGRHNPIGVDSIKAEQLCIKAAQIAGGVVMPAIHFAADAYWDAGFGIGHGMDATAGFQLPGSYYQIENALLSKFLVNACRNYLNRGFKLVVMVSGHNPTIQHNLMDEVCYICKTVEGDEPVCSTMDFALIKEGDPRRASDHAGGIETSMMLFLKPERVKMDANKGQDREQLGIGGIIPYYEATTEEGEIRFNMEVQGLVIFAKDKLHALNQLTR